MSAPAKSILNMGSLKIVSLADGTLSSDAINKGQLDNAINALWSTNGNGDIYRNTKVGVLTNNPTASFELGSGGIRIPANSSAPSTTQTLDYSDHDILRFGPAQGIEKYHAKTLAISQDTSWNAGDYWDIASIANIGGGKLKLDIDGNGAAFAVYGLYDIALSYAEDYYDELGFAGLTNNQWVYCVPKESWARSWGERFRDNFRIALRVNNNVAEVRLVCIVAGTIKNYVATYGDATLQFRLYWSPNASQYVNPSILATSGTGMTLPTTVLPQVYSGNYGYSIFRNGITVGESVKAVAPPTNGLLIGGDVQLKANIGLENNQIFQVKDADNVYRSALYAGSYILNIKAQSGGLRLRSYDDTAQVQITNSGVGIAGPPLGSAALGVTGNIKSTNSIWANTGLGLNNGADYSQVGVLNTGNGEWGGGYNFSLNGSNQTIAPANTGVAGIYYANGRIDLFAKTTQSAGAVITPTMRVYSGYNGLGGTLYIGNATSSPSAPNIIFGPDYGYPNLRGENLALTYGRGGIDLVQFHDSGIRISEGVTIESKVAAGNSIFIWKGQDGFGGFGNSATLQYELPATGNYGGFFKMQSGRDWGGANTSLYGFVLGPQRDDDQVAGSQTYPNRTNGVLINVTQTNIASKSQLAVLYVGLGDNAANTNRSIYTENGVVLAANTGSLSIGGTNAPAKLSVFAVPASATEIKTVAVFDSEWTAATGAGGGTAIEFRGKSSGGNIANWTQARLRTVGYASNNEHSFAIDVAGSAGGLVQGLTVSKLGIGIGTDTPNASIDIQKDYPFVSVKVTGGAAAYGGFTIYNPSVASGTAWYMRMGDAATSGRSSLYFSTLNYGATVLELAQNGTVGIGNFNGSTAPAATVDIRPSQSLPVILGRDNTGTELFRFEHGGSLALGTTSAQAKLHVYAASNATFGLQDSQSVLRFITASAQNFIQSGTSFSTSSADLLFTNMNGGTTNLAIKAGGNVAIGSANAAYKLTLDYNTSAATYAMGARNQSNFLSMALGGTATSDEGHLYLNSPAGQGSGSGVDFTSNGGAYGGFFQLDSAGNMVFRQSQQAMYFDYFSNCYFRSVQGGYGQAMSISSGRNVYMPVNLSIGTSDTSEALAVVGNIKITGIHKLFDSVGSLAGQITASTTQVSLQAQGTRLLSLVGGDQTTLNTSSSGFLKVDKTGWIGVVNSLTSDSGTIPNGGLQWRSDLDTFTVKKSSGAQRMATREEIYTTIRMDAVAPTVAIPGAGVVANGYWIVPTVHSGWQLKQITFCAYTAGSGTGTTVVRVKKGVTNLTNVTFNTGQTGLELTLTSTTVTAGDKILFEVVSNTMTTPPQGMVVLVSLSKE